MQTLLIIQRTQLYYGYCTVFLKQNREKLFVATTKHLRATFGQFFADFSAQFARNFCNLCATCVQFKLRAILAHFQLNLRATCANFPFNFSAFSTQFSRKF